MIYPRARYRFANFLLIAAAWLCLTPLAWASDPSVPNDTTQPAVGPCVCAASMTAGQLVRNTIKTQAEEERRHITQGFSDFETWIVKDFFNNDILPALKSMAASLTAAGMQQVAIFGGFLDAKQQLEVQATLQSLTADAHQNYQTSSEMCAIGTAAIGMAAADRNGEAVAQELARRSASRQLSSTDTAAADGPATDRDSRFKTFKLNHCDPQDNDGGFASICTGTAAPGMNRDINYSQTMEGAQNLNFNFDGQSFGAGDADVAALASNLFGHGLFTLQSTAIMKNPNAHEPYLDARAVIAKRSVAENSFFAIAGMKSAGSATAAAEAPYIQAIFQQLGASPDEAKNLVGTRPSYYSLLDAMSRRLYQSPQFFSNLYDTPANVERKDVAMQAIGLMLDRDQYKSDLRSEANLAVLLELELQPTYQKVQNRITGAEQQ